VTAIAAVQRFDPHNFFSKPLIAQLVKSSKFEVIIGVFVVLNAIVLGIESHMEAQRTEEWHDMLMALEYIFGVTFITEVAMRIYVFGWGFFTGHGRHFNLLDLSLVILQIVQTSLGTLPKAALQSRALKGLLSALRILKLIRLLRIARILRQIQDLRTLVFSIIVSLRS